MVRNKASLLETSIGAFTPIYLCAYPPSEILNLVLRFLPGIWFFRENFQKLCHSEDQENLAGFFSPSKIRILTTFGWTPSREFNIPPQKNIRPDFFTPLPRNFFGNPCFFMPLTFNNFWLESSINDLASNFLIFW